jgi:hypothetical protein
MRNAGTHWLDLELYEHWFDVMMDIVRATHRDDVPSLVEPAVVQSHMRADLRWLKAANHTTGRPFAARGPAPMINPTAAPACKVLCALDVEHLIMRIAIRHCH